METDNTTDEALSVRTRSRNPFTTVTTSGLLLPIDLLARIVDGDVDGLQPKDYHLRSGERLNEAAARAWNECLAAWKTFRRRFAALPASDAGTTVTRDEWLLPLFQELGYGRLQTKRAITIEDREYPVSHGWENHVPIHLLSARYPLDRRSPGVSGAATRSPYSLLQELLNRSAAHRWGFVSNGLKLYLLRDNAALARAANVEFDLEAMLDGEVYSDFQLLFLLCHQSRVEIQPRLAGGGAGKKRSSGRKAGARDDDNGPSPDSAGRPEDCWLEKWATQADQQGTRAREKLRNGVEAAINALGAGFLASGLNSQLREDLSTGTLPTQDYYRQLLRLVYRLLLLLVAEEKQTETGDNLLHPTGTPAAVRERYTRFYSVGRLRALADRRRGTAHVDLYESLKVLFTQLREGCPSLGIPGLGSLLFSDRSTPDLDDARLANRDLLDAVRQLCFTEDTSGRGGAIRRPVDFGNLGSEELGSVYESLLELHPRIDTDEGPFTLDTAAGHERKTTGSYYTPRSLINCLLDSALEPVVREAIDVPDQQEAIQRLLDLKICDPACGSGHFLIAAAERMALHLARLRSGDDEPAMLDVQRAKREIIGRCVYGVDVNPMAVELCKVSLWMEALEPGRPLGFLEHHIQCGNSLLGTTPRLLAEGIPDDAFKPIEGDDKEVCRELKKQNRKERKEYQQGYRDFHFRHQLGDLPAEFARLTSRTEESVIDAREKADAYARLVGTVAYENARLLADGWCATFVWKKNNSDLGQLCLTERDFRNLQASPHTILPHVRQEVERLREEYGFFHWHLAFPDVFRVPGEHEESVEQRAGWTGGFDAVIGNPPWELVTADPNGPSGEMLPRVQHMFGVNEYAVLSGRRDLYKLFLVRSQQLVATSGRLGLLVPLGGFIEDESSDLRRELFRNGTVIDHRHYQNSGKSFFAKPHASYRFCHVIWTPIPRLPHQFWTVAHRPDEMSYQSAIRVLPDGVLAELGPSFSAILYETRAHAEVHRRASQMLRAQPQAGFVVKAEFHGSSDKKLFSSAAVNVDDWGVLKNRHIHQFNDTFAAVEDFVPSDEVRARLRRKGFDESWMHRPRLVFRDIARNDDERTLIACLALPGLVSTYDTPMVKPAEEQADIVRSLAFSCGMLNAFAFDFAIRPYVDKHIKGYVLERVPWPAISGSKLQEALLNICVMTVLELTCTRRAGQQFAADCGYEGPPFVWDEDRRFELRCELDAAYFHLYLGTDDEWRETGSPELLDAFPAPRDAVDYIMDTFPIVRRKDEKSHGEYRTKNRILAIYDAMAEAIRTGEPYRTELNPPPGPPAEWYDAAQQKHIAPPWNEADWPDHVHRPRDIEVEPGKARPHREERTRRRLQPAAEVDAQVFPRTAVERTMCGLLLDLVAARPGQGREFYLDAMILAADVRSRAALTAGTEAAALAGISLVTTQEVRQAWAELQPALDGLRALRVEGANLVVGDDFNRIRSAFPAIDERMVSLLLGAADRMREIMPTGEGRPAAGSAQEQEATTEIVRLRSEVPG